MTRRALTGAFVVRGVRKRAYARGLNWTSRPSYGLDGRAHWMAPDCTLIWPADDPRSTRDSAHDLVRAGSLTAHTQALALPARELRTTRAGRAVAYRWASNRLCLMGRAPCLMDAALALAAYGSPHQSAWAPP